MGGQAVQNRSLLYALVGPSVDLSVPRGAVREHYGGWDAYIR